MLFPGWKNVNRLPSNKSFKNVLMLSNANQFRINLQKAEPPITFLLITEDLIQKAGNISASHVQSNTFLYIYNYNYIYWV